MTADVADEIAAARKYARERIAQAGRELKDDSPHKSRLRELYAIAGTSDKFLPLWAELHAIARTVPPFTASELRRAAEACEVAAYWAALEAP